MDNMLYMKRIFRICIILAFFSTVSIVSATVGGEKHMDSFTYNPANESVYYIKSDFGGRGCPPELFKMSLVSGKTDIVIPCGDDMNDVLNRKIQAATSGFKPLIPFELGTHAIAINVAFVRSEQYSPEIDEISMSHFTATVYQDEKKVYDFPVQGCSAGQPFTFQGYSIPGYDKKIIVRLTTKGDCFEGGYKYDTAHVVGGVTGFYTIPADSTVAASTQNIPSVYSEFIKPSWAPPSWIFGPVWTLLYTVIILSFGRVFYLYFKKKISFFVALPFALNIFFNLIFTWIQFGLLNNILATIDILLVLGTLGWAMYVIRPHARLVAYAQIPYFIWVSFATVLQISVTYLNR